ncbi:MAG: HNH endonuclease [Candidatus Pacebacteria bacterium]|nr:HNH endonuclease [Candidatus Paceibacterota bacterium]
MKEQILKIHKDFYDSLSSDENKRKVLKIYGYNSPDEFLSGVINRLNDEYNFLKISEFDFLSRTEKGEYYQYNGYIEGVFNDYDLITVSFTDIKGKEGNVFMSQQVMPMITSKLKDDKKFLLSNRIKKICILTTHKSDIFSPEKNIISDSGISNIQMSVKYINTIGFDVIDFFHIKNLSIKSKYHNIDELINHVNYLQKKNPTNSQFQQIINKDDLFYADFEKDPVGQEIKFFALKLYAAIILLRGQSIDISRAIKRTSNKNKSDITLRVMNGFVEYLLHTDLSAYDIFRVSVEEEEREAEIIEITEVRKEKVQKTDKVDIPCYEQEPIFDYNRKGRRIFKTQRIFKKRSFERHGYKCACNDDEHLYFIADATQKPYVEGHHMIPMEFQEQYWTDKKRNLDCAINLIPLCPHCHSKIHKAVKGERIQIITNVFTKYQKQLETIDNDLTLEKFAELYNVYIY